MGTSLALAANLGLAGQQMKPMSNDRCKCFMSTGQFSCEHLMLLSLRQEALHMAPWPLSAILSSLTLL